MTTNSLAFEHGPRSNTYRVHEFDPTSYDWDDWEVLFNTYIDVEGVTDDTKKRNLLITALAVQPFKTLISVCKPRKPTDYSFSEVIEKLRTNYKRVTFSSTERVKFFATRQQTSQTLTDFANGLRDKTETCAFPCDFYEDALITAFVGGLQNDQVRKHLMQKNLQTFEHTLNTARTFESVLVQGAHMKTNSSEELSVMQIKKKSRFGQKDHDKSVCFSCGSKQHSRPACRFRAATCHSCGKEGHISKVCRSNGRPSPSKSNTIATVTTNAIATERAFFISVQLNGVDVRFELDTGSPVTLINEQVWKLIGKPQLQPLGFNCNSFSGHPIRFRRQALVQAKLHELSVQLHVVVSYENQANLLGRDWLIALRLNSQPLDEIISSKSIHQVGITFQDLDSLLAHYRELFQDSLGCCTVKAHLHVKPDAIPKFCKARSLPFAYRQAVETDLDRLVTEGVLEPISVSKWAAPIVVVPKPNGNVRLCADLSTGVNQSLDIDQYPLPKPNDLFVALNGGVWFSKIDFSEAYLQVEIDDSSKELLVINTHKGLFRFNRLPFAVASAPSIFQKIMDQMLAGVEGVVCYLDDIIVTGRTKAEHLQRLNVVFARIEAFGFHVNKKKCIFLQNHVEYLGFVVDKHGVHTSSSKTKAIVNMPKPSNLSQLRSFLGMVNHYAKFISNLSDRLTPFYVLLKKDAPWIWTAQCDIAFKTIKRTLISPLALTHYDPSLPLILAADASNTGVGAVLYHRYTDGSEKVIAHASKTLTSTESKYAQIEKEALALIYGVQKFDQFVRGRRFTLLTDHKPLITIFGPKKGIPTTSANRLQRWALRLMGYVYDIEYRSTHDFGHADGLSRLPIGPDLDFDSQDPGETKSIMFIQQELQRELPLRANDIARATRKDPILMTIYHYILAGWPSTANNTGEFQSYYRLRHEFSTANGCITWGLRTVIPKCYRNRLLQYLHESHPGMTRMKGNARHYIWWPSIDRDIEELVKNCPSCSTISKQPMKVPLSPWPTSTRPWERIHLDFMGKFFNSYYLIVVDSYSKWLEVFPMKMPTTDATINALTNLFARFGLCETIVSDNGSQFTSNDFSEFCARNGIKHLTTPPGHPQSNGQAERYVDIVKSAINKGVYGGGNVSDVLLKFLFHYRITPHATTQSSPAELFLKRSLRTVLDLLRPNTFNPAEPAHRRYQRNFDQHTSQRHFREHEHVFVRDFRNNPHKVNWTPGVLISREGSRVWLVKVDNVKWRRHENQIRHRAWSTDDDILTADSNTTAEVVPATHAPNPQSHKPNPTLREPSKRLRKPVKRLIEEI